MIGIRSRKWFNLFAVPVIVAALAGCSFFGPSRQPLTINTVPSGAAVKLNGMLIGTSPVSVDVERNRRHTILAELEGYSPMMRTTDYTLSTLGVLDIVGTLLIILPVLGLISPGAYEQQESTIMLNLSPERGAPSAPVARTTTVAPRQRSAPTRPTAGGDYEPVVPPAGFNLIRAAVLPIIPQQNASADDAATLSNFLEPSIFNQGRYVYELVDRTVVEQTIQELGFQQSDYTDKTAAEQIGQLLGVKHLVVGTYSQSGDGSFNSLSVRIIEISTNRVLALSLVTDASTGAVAQQVPDLVNDLLNDLLERMVPGSSTVR